jgi:hypothetical protein
MRKIEQTIGRRLAAIKEKLIPSNFRTIVVWKDVLGEDKSEQTIAKMRADGRLTEQDRLLVVSFRPPEREGAVP